jgi:uncharacterized lipoprotein YmbA
MVACTARFKGIVTVLFCLNIVACIGGKSAPTQFYMLDAVLPASVNQTRLVEGSVVLVGLAPVEVPEYLNRPQIVTHMDRDEYHLDESHQWLEPLGDNLTRVIAENLSEMLASEGIDILSLSRSGETDYIIAVQVLRMNGKLGHDMVLAARWTLFKRKNNDILLTRRSVFKASAVDDTYQGLMQALNRLVESLSLEIADGIRSKLR